MVLPLVSALQWFVRSYRGRQAVLKQFGSASQKRRSRRWRRVFVRLFLGVAGALQVGLLLSFDLNASHGGLINYWLVFLLGAVFESLLGLDDIKGMFRQLLVALVFIMI